MCLWTLRHSKHAPVLPRPPHQPPSKPSRMLSSTELLTSPTLSIGPPQEYVPASERHLLESSLLFLHPSTGGDSAHAMEPAGRDSSARSRRSGSSVAPSGSRNDELWFSMPGSQHRAAEQRRPAQEPPPRPSTRPDPMALRPNANTSTGARTHSPSATGAASRSPRNKALPVPPVATTIAPPPVDHAASSPASARKKSRKSPSIRTFMRHRNSSHLDPDDCHLPPGQRRQRSTSDSDKRGNASPAEPYEPYRNFSSRSMPAFPQPFSHPSASLLRVRSTESRSTPCASTVSAPLPHMPQSPPGGLQRATSTNVSPLESQPMRTRRTFPEPSSPTPRPHTWLTSGALSEPAEPFEDASQFHLFVEATSGLHDGGVGATFGAISPPRPGPRLFSSHSVVSEHTSAWQPSPQPSPQLRAYSQPSLGHQPLPVQDSRPYDYGTLPSYAHPPSDPSPVCIAGMPSILPPSPLSNSAHRAPPAHLNAINLELERLGFDDENPPGEDELPDYAQSQAEVAEARRREAAARAKELESRWNTAREQWGRR